MAANTAYFDNKDITLIFEYWGEFFMGVWLTYGEIWFIGFGYA